MKKVVFTSLAILTLSTTSTFASSNVEESKMTKTNYEFTQNEKVSSTESENVGVTEGPSVESRGLSTPAEIKDLSGTSSYSFIGTASRSDLYTDYKFIGKTIYNIKVKNKSDKNLKVVAYKDGKVLAHHSTEISGNSTTYYSITGLKTSDKIYLRFVAPSDFSGTID